MAHTAIDGLHVTTADRGLAETESLLATKIGKEFMLRDALVCTRTHYDVIVIDCPPNLGNLTLCALVAADWVLVPCDASSLAVQGVSDIVRTMAVIETRLNRQLDLLGVLLTRIDGRNRQLNAAVVDGLRADYGELLLETEIGVDTSLAKAQFEGASVFEFDGECRAAEQYRKLSDEVLRRICV